MDANSRWESEGIGGPFLNDKDFIFCTRVRDVREELGRRIQRGSASSPLTIADQLLLAYYQKALSFIEPLSPEKRFHAGWPINCSSPDRQKEVRQILQILDYLAPKSAEMKKGLLRALPISCRISYKKKGAPVTRREAALRALQLQIDTGRTWTSIAQEVCDCKKKHSPRCTENIRQSVNGLKRFLRKLGIELPKVKQQGRQEATSIYLPRK
jgi:hypothetical protein